MRNRLMMLACAAAVLGAVPGGVSGENRVLTFGGGPSPNMSQASLEQNVLYLRRVLKNLGMESLKHDVYFTDGTTSGRTVELKVNEKEGDLRQTLAGLWGGGDGESVQMIFRSPKIEDLAGPSTVEAVGKWFDSTGKGMKPHEKLMVYFTGHGSPVRTGGGGGGRRGMGGGGGGGGGGAPAVQGPPLGTVMDMWGRGGINTKDFCGQLDKLDPDVDVTLVMVQCFSGGFANVIYKDADPAKGFAKGHRCGFFATTSTRMAAGCTADIEGDEYEEFSTSFFAALSGKSRSGKEIAPPDYDKNGVVSFDEAFAYVVLTSNTIDIPVTTTDQLLRDKSRYSRGGPAEAKLLVRDADYSKLMAVATPAQKAMLEGLSTILEIKGENRVATVRNLAGNIDQERAAIQKTERDLESEMSRQAMAIRTVLETKWPELAIRWHPGIEEIIVKDGKAMLEALEGNATYKAWKGNREKLNAAAEKDWALEKKWVKTQRFLSRCESIVLAANLKEVGAADVLEFYKGVLKMESGGMAEWKK